MSAAVRPSPLSGESIYVAGPMRGLPEHNYPAFNSAAAMLRAAGAHVVNPVEVNHGADDDGTQPPEFYVRRDLTAMLGVRAPGALGFGSAGCNAIALLPGWERSVGARCEATVALTLGFRFYDATTGEQIAPPESVTCTGGYGCAPGSVDTLDMLAYEIRAWQRDTFPRATPASVAEHLRREAEELCKDPTDLEERADVFMLVVGDPAATPRDLVSAVRAKLEKNRARVWGKPDAHGVVEHVREGGAA